MPAKSLDMVTEGAMAYGAHLVRSLRWTQYLSTGVIAIAMAWLITRQPESITARHLLVRMAVLVSVLGVAFVFDDEAESLTQASPVRLFLRRAARSFVGSIPSIALMATVLFVSASDLNQAAVAGDEAAVHGRFPFHRLFLEGLALTSWSLAAAALVAREYTSQPGRTASALILIIWAASWVLPGYATPWTLPGDDRWASTNVIWGFLLFLGLTTATLASWDTRTRMRRSIDFRPLTPHL